MKRILLSLIIATSLVSVNRAADQAGYVDFGKLNPSGESQFVEVNIKSNLIAMVASFAKKAEPEVAEMINGLKQIRVNVLGLNKENRAEMKDRVGAIRDGLDKAGWERVVTAIEKGQDVGVFLKMKSSEAVEGLCVTVLQGDQVVLVNIIGDIRPDKLATVGERFNIEPLKHIPARSTTTTPSKEKSEKTDDSKS